MPGGVHVRENMNKTSPRMAARLPARLGQWPLLVLQDEHLPQLQAFYEANPLYFEATGGEPAQPGDAEADLHFQLPEGMSMTARWFLAITDEAGQWLAVAEIVQDLMADDVWHLALFIVDSRWHGQGLAQRLYQALEDIMLAAGARWLRLNVVLGHQRAERFWHRQGYIEVRQRHGVEMGQQVNTLWVMIKPVRASLEAYLASVPRDRPDQG